MSRWLLTCCVSILWVATSGCVASTSSVEAVKPDGTVAAATETASPAPHASFALAQPVVPSPTVVRPSPSGALRVRPGIEVLVEDQPAMVEGKRVGLITNPTGIGADLNQRSLPGVRFWPAYFQSTKPGEKFFGEMAGGVETYFTDRLHTGGR